MDDENRENEGDLIFTAKAPHSKTDGPVDP
ncbi:3,4-dihydroxy-2-butanone-4-phosphate synthase [Endozoicomonas sp. SESOKO2]